MLKEWEEDNRQENPKGREDETSEKKVLLEAVRETETPTNSLLVDGRVKGGVISPQELQRLFVKFKKLQEQENASFKQTVQEEISLLKEDSERQEKETSVLRHKTQRVGQWEIAERNFFFVRMYLSFCFQFVFTMALVFAWVWVYKIKEEFREDPLPLSVAILVGSLISCFFLCGFRRWTLLSLVSINLTFSLLVGIGVLYTDSTFLLECMGAVAIFAALLVVLNSQQKWAYSTGVLVCLMFMLFLMTLWHFVYVPYHAEFTSLNSVFDTVGLKVERLVALVVTVFACCGYMIYFEEGVKKNYLINEHLHASIHLYLHILIFIYVLAQLLHFWSLRCRRCRRGADAYVSA